MLIILIVDAYLNEGSSLIHVRARKCYSKFGWTHCNAPFCEFSKRVLISKFLLASSQKQVLESKFSKVSSQKRVNNINCRRVPE
jgi:hypothetical protein